MRMRSIQQTESAEKRWHQYSKRILAAGILLLHMVQSQFTSVVQCPLDTTLTGYVSVSALNNDMAVELDRIRGGGAPQASYLLVLCPGTTFDTNADGPLTPVISNVTFQCGADGQASLGCVFDSMNTIRAHIRIRDISPPIEGYVLGTMAFQGLSFRNNAAASMSGRADAPALAHFIDCQWQDFAGSEMIDIQRTPAPMSVTLEASRFEPLTTIPQADILVNNQGGIVLARGVSISNVQAQRFFQTEAGGSTDIDGLQVSGSQADVVIAVVEGSTGDIRDISVTNNVAIATVIGCSDSGSVLNVDSMVLSDNDFLEPLIGIIVTTGCTGTVKNSTFARNAPVSASTYAVSGGSPTVLQVSDTSFLENDMVLTGISAQMLSDGAQAQASLLRGRIEANIGSSEYYHILGINTGGFSFEQSCFDFNTAGSIALAAEGSAFEVANNFVGSNENSDCVGVRVFPADTCEPVVSDSPTCLADITESPTFAPSIMSSPTAIPTADVSSHPSGSPSSLMTSAPTGSGQTPTSSPTQATALPTRFPTRFPTLSPSRVPVTSAPTSSDPVSSPTSRPTASPTVVPTFQPTTSEPTTAPSVAPIQTSAPTPTPINDRCTNAFEIESASTVISGSTLSNAPDGNILSCVDGVSNSVFGVWYTLVGRNAGIRMTVCVPNGVTDFDTVISVFRGSCESLVCEAGGRFPTLCAGMSRNLQERSLQLASSTGSVEWFGDQGETYFIRVGGFGSAVGSFELSISEVEPPVNGECNGAIPIEADGSVTVQSNFASLPDRELNTCTVPAYHGLWYHITGTGAEFTATTCTDETEIDDTALSVYQGPCNNLVCITGDDEDPDCMGASGRSTATWQTELGVIYTLRTSGFLGATGTIGLSVTATSFPVNDRCIGALSLPTDGSTIVASTLTARADGIPPCGGISESVFGLWYTIFGEGVDVIVSTCSEYTDFDTTISVYQGECDSLSCITGGDDDPECSMSPNRLTSKVQFRANQSTIYYVRVGGLGDRKGTFGLFATVAALPPPNNLCQHALSLPTDGRKILGTTVASAPTPDIPVCIAGHYYSGDVWYKFVGAGSKIKVTTCLPETDFDTIISVYQSPTKNCNNLMCVAGKDDDSYCRNTASSTLEFYADTNVAYFIRINGFGDESGNFGIRAFPVGGGGKGSPSKGSPSKGAPSKGSTSTKSAPSKGQGPNSGSKSTKSSTKDTKSSKSQKSDKSPKSTKEYAASNDYHFGLGYEVRGSESESIKTRWAGQRFGGTSNGEL